MTVVSGAVSSAVVTVVSGGEMLASPQPASDNISNAEHKMVGILFFMKKFSNRIAVCNKPITEYYFEKQNDV